MLFPGAPTTAVVSQLQASPVLDTIRNNVARLGENLDILDINLEVMQDIPDDSVPEDQVREVGDLFSIYHDDANSVLESNNSQENFSGYLLSTCVYSDIVWSGLAGFSLWRVKTSLCRYVLCNCIIV